MRLVSLVLLLLIAGCAHSLVVYAPAQLPARVPVQVFPSVWVVGPAEQEEGYLLDRIASQLAQDPRREVRRLDAPQLKAARQAGQLSPVTVVLQLELTLSSGTQDYVDTVPLQYCGMFGCSMQYQTYVNVVAQVSGRATLSVQEGPTGRELQRERFAVHRVGEDERALQDELWEQLAHELTQAVGISQIKEPYHLYRCDQDDAERGVALIERGRWTEGRAELELAAQRLGGLDKKSQAEVWYNLGIARMIAPGPKGLTPEAVAAAERALEWAQRLTPNEAHRQALRRLAELRKRREIIVDQHRAEQHNFGLVTGG